MRKIKMTKFNLIILGLIGLFVYIYFNRIDGYLGRIEQFNNYVPLDILRKVGQMKKIPKFLILILKWDISISLIAFAIIILQYFVDYY